MANPKNLKLPKGVKGIKPAIHEDLIKPPPVLPYEGRANIGARNPLVLALHQLADLNQPLPHSITDLRELIEMAFGDHTYEEMFDPRYDSPVYFGLYRKTS